MIAVDTNVLVRLLVADDPAQAARARALAETERIHVSVTVLLEAEWILRSLYRASRADIETGLRTVLRTAHVEDAARVGRALDLLALGIDFADALHLARAAHATAFITFDQKLVRRARKLGVQPAVRFP